MLIGTSPWVVVLFLLLQLHFVPHWSQSNTIAVVYFLVISVDFAQSFLPISDIVHVSIVAWLSVLICQHSSSGTGECRHLCSPLSRASLSSSCFISVDVDLWERDLHITMYVIFCVSELLLETSFFAREVPVVFHFSNSPFCRVLVLRLNAFPKLFTKLFISDFVLKIK